MEESDRSSRCSKGKELAQLFEQVSRKVQFSVIGGSARVAVALAGRLSQFHRGELRGVEWRN
jgi:hypothetical protein